MNRTTPPVTDVRHIKLCYSKDRYCGHPRQSPVRNFGNGEIAVAHFHAPATYETRENIGHGHHNYMGRSQVLFQRSLDHGETWLPENDVVIWDHARPLDERRAILHRADEPGVAREEIDLTSPDAAVAFPRHATGPDDPEGRPSLECFAVRSGDRGAPGRRYRRASRRRPASTSSP